MRTIQTLADEAIFIQSACNGLAIANKFGPAITDLRNSLEVMGLPYGTDAIRAHPIYRLWASKIHDLAGLGLSDDERYSDAYWACKEMAAGTYYEVKEVGA